MKTSLYVVSDILYIAEEVIVRFDDSTPYTDDITPSSLFWRWSIARAPEEPKGKGQGKARANAKRKVKKGLYHIVVGAYFM